MKVLWLGQGGLLFVSGKRKVMVDPYLTNSLSLIDYTLDRQMKVNKKIFSVRPDVIVLTNCHPDHADIETISKFAKKQKSKLTILSCESVFCDIADYESCALANNIMLEAGSEWSIEGFNILAVTAKTDDRSAIGVIITDTQNGKRYYVAGDTLYSKYVLQDLPKDIYATFLPINGEYGSMNVLDAKRFALQINSKYVVPVHFGMFDKVDPSALDLENKIIPTPYRIIDFESEVNVPDKKLIDRKFNEKPAPAIENEQIAIVVDDEIVNEDTLEDTLNEASDFESIGTINEVDDSEVEAEATTEDEVIKNEIEAEATAEDEVIENEVEAEATTEDEVIENEVEAEATTEDEVVENEIEVEATTEDEVVENEIEVEATAEDEVVENEIEAEVETYSEDEVAENEIEVEATVEDEVVENEAEADATTEAEADDVPLYDDFDDFDDSEADYEERKNKVFEPFSPEELMSYVSDDENDSLPQEVDESEEPFDLSSELDAEIPDDYIIEENEVDEEYAEDEEPSNDDSSSTAESEDVTENEAEEVLDSSTDTSKENDFSDFDDFDDEENVTDTEDGDISDDANDDVTDDANDDVTDDANDDVPDDANDDVTDDAKDNVPDDASNDADTESSYESEEPSEDENDSSASTYVSKPQNDDADDADLIDAYVKELEKLDRGETPKF